jgi:hypothetical protein
VLSPSEVSCNGDTDRANQRPSQRADNCQAPDVHRKANAEHPADADQEEDAVCKLGSEQDDIKLIELCHSVGLGERGARRVERRTGKPWTASVEDEQQTR